MTKKTLLIAGILLLAITTFASSVFYFSRQKSTISNQQLTINN